MMSLFPMDSGTRRCTSSKANRKQFFSSFIIVLMNFLRLIVSNLSSLLAIMFR